MLAITNWSVGWKLVQVIAPSKQSYFCIYFLFYTSQISSFLSYPPEQTSDISGFTLALLIQLLWPKKDPLNFRVSMSHILTLLSSLAVSSIFPSPKKSTHFTAAVWPLIVLVLILLPGYHNLTVVSYDELAITFSLGEKETAEILFVCPSRVKLRLGLLIFHSER